YASCELYAYATRFQSDELFVIGFRVAFIKNILRGNDVQAGFFPDFTDNRRFDILAFTHPASNQREVYATFFFSAHNQDFAIFDKDRKSTRLNSSHVKI